MSSPTVASLKRLSNSSNWLNQLESIITHSLYQCSPRSSLLSLSPPWPSLSLPRRPPVVAFKDLATLGKPTAVSGSVNFFVVVEWHHCQATTSCTMSKKTRLMFSRRCTMSMFLSIPMSDWPAPLFLALGLVAILGLIFFFFWIGDELTFINSSNQPVCCSGNNFCTCSLVLVYIY